MPRQVPFVPALAAAAVLLAMHWLFSALAFPHRFGEAVKGEPRVLIRDGTIDWEAMRHAHVSERDLWEDLRRRLALGAGKRGAAGAQR